MNHVRLFRLHRQEKLGSASGRPEPSVGHAIADESVGGAEPALVARPRVGRLQ